MAVVGSTTPRLYTAPLRELTEDTSFGREWDPAWQEAWDSSWGYDVVWFARYILGEPLTRWQEWLSIHALEVQTFDIAVAQAETDAERREIESLYASSANPSGSAVPPVPRGVLRFKTILVLVARQNGKTHWSKVLIKWALFRMRLPYILGAAQTKNDASELWEEIRDECEGHPRLRKNMRRTSNAHGFEALRSKTGAYRIAGLDRRAGRGKTVNLLYMDELREHKKWDGWNALSSTTMSPALGFNVATSNAGDLSSVVLRSLRTKARAAVDAAQVDTTVGLFEWSADPALAPSDRRAWAQANPDLGHGRMTERDIQGEFENKEEPAFRTENLCQWVEDLEADKFVPLVPIETWGKQTVRNPVEVGECAVAVEVNPDGDRVTVVAAGQTLQGTHVQALVVDDPFVVDEVVAAIAEFVSEFDPAMVILDKDTPASVLIPGLRLAGIDPVLLTGGTVSLAFRGFRQSVIEDKVTNDGEQAWVDALSVAKERVSKEGKYPAVDRFSGAVSVLVAGTFAAWGLSTFLAESGSVTKQAEVKKLNPKGTFPKFATKKRIGGGVSA